MADDTNVKELLDENEDPVTVITNSLSSAQDDLQTADDALVSVLSDELQDAENGSTSSVPTQVVDPVATPLVSDPAGVVADPQVQTVPMTPVSETATTTDDSVVNPEATTTNQVPLPDNSSQKIYDSN